MPPPRLISRPSTPKRRPPEIGALGYSEALVRRTASLRLNGNRLNVTAAAGGSGRLNPVREVLPYESSVVIGNDPLERRVVLVRRGSNSHPDRLSFLRPAGFPAFPQSLRRPNRTNTLSCTDAHANATRRTSARAVMQADGSPSRTTPVADIHGTGRQSGAPLAAGAILRPSSAAAGQRPRRARAATSIPDNTASRLRRLLGYGQLAARCSGTHSNGPAAT